MTRHIGQRFLCDTEQLSLDGVIQTVGERGRIERRNSGSFAEVIGQPAETVVEAKIVEEGRAEKLRDLANIPDGIFHKAQAIFQPSGMKGTGILHGDQISFDGAESLS